MKRILLLIAMLLALGASSLTASAQDADKATYECLYLIKAYTDTTQREVAATDMMVLRLNDKRSIFYSEATRRIDSTIYFGDAEKILADIIANGTGVLGQKGVTYSLLKDFSNQKIDYRRELYDKEFQYEEPLPDFGWQISNETKQIGDYTCQKAVCDFRGRRYEAWFTSEIPIKDGPWKFCGLPGLILSVADTAGHYSFTFIEMRPSQEKVDFIPRPAVRTSRKEMLKVYRRYVKDPFGSLDKPKERTPEQEKKLRERNKHIKFDPMERDL